MKSHPGQVLYTEANGLYTIYKVLETAETEWYVRCSWPSPVQPGSNNYNSYDLRTACEAQPITAFAAAVLLAEEPVTATELVEYEQFLRIRAGIAHRAESWKELLRQADALFEQEYDDAALALYTEAAPFSKYDPTIFERRGRCLLRLNRFSEAIADFEHALTISPEGINCLWHCAQAYYGNGNKVKALEKMEQLRQIDPDYPKLGETIHNWKTQ